MYSADSGSRPVQRISKVRRDYNRWVADETLEDYALRFAPRSFRKWSSFRVANTAFGAVSFLALEAIGAAITLSYGFVNAMWAIGVVSLVIFLTGLPIAWQAARNGLDMDLLTRGAGFGYLGSTLTSLIYAGFTFIFFALEAAIMAQAFELWFDLPRPIAQIKINVTNAYAGSLAWSNFFARLTHSHPGRVVWLLFNVIIAVLLMAMGVFEALEQVLGLYSHLAVAWVGAIVADLVISKPLGWSPRQIEFRRAHLYDINPSGFGAMLLASVLSVSAHLGLMGEHLQPASAAIALGVALVAAPLIARLTGGRFFIARQATDFGPRHRVMRCTVCRNRFESDDMAQCPAYGGVICSLCCTLDARCGDRCKPGSQMHEQLAPLLSRVLPRGATPAMVRRVGHYTLVLSGMFTVLGSTLWLLYAQERLRLDSLEQQATGDMGPLFIKILGALVLLAAVAAWWLVLANESRQVAQQESDRQNQLLQREIDAHRHTDELLQSAKEAAESANHAKSRFLTGMSHEMRSPLNSILGYSQVMLRNHELGRAQHDAVSTIRRSGEHLSSLVDGLLELSRIEAGKLSLMQEPLDLAEFLRQIQRMFEPLAQSKGLEFSFSTSGRLPPRVSADPKRLRQILINLMGNAIKFTERGSVSVHVRYQREIAHIEVSDTGIGIAPDDHERIFKPFERLAAGSSVEGTGLGLTITQLLVDLMGGDIRLDSMAGQGSRFRVRVYLPAIEGTPRDDASRQVIAYRGALRRLLIVDDEAAHRAVLRELLAPLGFEIREAALAGECLAHLDSEPFDAVLLDINLPDADGWSVARAIAARAGVSPPVLIVSGNVHDNTAALRAGSTVAGFVAKPVNESDLLEALRTTLRLEWLAIPGGDTHQPLPDLDPELARELLSLSAQGRDRALLARLAEAAEESAGMAHWSRRLAGLLARDRQALHDTLGDSIRRPTGASIDG